MLTIFCLIEFGLAAWSYFDDTAILDTDCLASSSWYLFLKLHALLHIPLKGNPQRR